VCNPPAASCTTCILHFVCIVFLSKQLTAQLGLQARSMTDKARFAAAGAMSNVRTAIDSAKRIGFTGNSVCSILCSHLFTTDSMFVIDSMLLHQQ